RRRCPASALPDRLRRHEPCAESGFDAPLRRTGDAGVQDIGFALVGRVPCPLATVGLAFEVAKRQQNRTRETIMREAVIVSTARTPIGKAYRGAFNNLEGPTMGAHAVKAALTRANLDPAEVDDVIMGAALQQGTTGYNVGRQIAVASGMPASVAGMSMDRQCSSGLMAISTAAKQIVCDNMDVCVAGGLEQISLVQNEHRNSFRTADPTVLELSPHLYIPMIDTAEIVAQRYGIGREAQD